MGEQVQVDRAAGDKRADRLNNFDLIRLVAAAQVVLWHGIEHLGMHAPDALRLILGSFPGVPIFFVVSGYLVTASFRRSRGTRQYFRNRALRIFPGLRVCFIFTFSSIVWVRGLNGVSSLDLAKWIIPNILGVSYTPWFLRDFASGSVNGSLWTIPVELQFYLVLPLMVSFLARSGYRWTAVFAVCVLISIGYIYFIRGESSHFVANVALRALPTWLYMFILGMLLELRRDWVQRFMVGRFALWIAAYAVWVTVVHLAGFNTIGNTASPLVLIPLAGVVISAAYSYCGLASFLLCHNDISYGVYLYHIPIINLIVATHPELMNGVGLALCVILTGLAATISWALVERPALRRKPASRPRSA